MFAETLLICASLTVYDGDTVRCDGQRLRLLGSGVVDVRGIDTPELSKWKCQKERRLARIARARLKQLIDGKKVKIVSFGPGRRDTRPLVNIYLPDGREAGQVLLKEGHARVWLPDRKNDWCE